MKRIAAIGELLIDFVPQERGCSLDRVVHFERVAGGAPANVVTAVSRLGGRGVMISQVGEDAFGRYILSVLKNNGVDTRYVFRTKQANTGLAFVSLDAAGDREFAFFRNPSADLFLNPEQITGAMLDDTAILHFCSVDLVDWPVREAHRKLIALARERRVLVSFDPNVRLPLWDTPEACRAAIRSFLPLADVVKLSDDELEFVTGSRDERTAAAQLLSGNCKMLILTKGSGGSCVYTRGAAAFVPAIPLERVVDTTGAGDSFIGSFLFRLVQKNIDADALEQLSSEELSDLLTFSGRYAARTIGKRGAVMATMEEMRQAYSLD